VTSTYWLDLFSLETWNEFLDHGGKVSGFGEKRWKSVQQIKPGDILLCYLTKASRWVGLLEVTGAAYWDESRIWASSTFPCRVPVKVLVALKPEHGVPVLEMREELTVFEGLTNPNWWSGPFRGSPAKWKTADGQAVTRAVHEASMNPLERPLPRSLKANSINKAETVETAAGTVSVPSEEPSDSQKEEVEHQIKETTSRTHTEIQYKLLKLGGDMGFNVHVARNDASQEWEGKKFADIHRVQSTLPKQFDQATNKIVELIDVLWLKGNAIVAAFEVESTTSIYSGLLRMSDLVAMQPNISIPLFLVAGEERRGKVIEQVNRATFSRMTPPLAEICRYISFEGLREALHENRNVIRFLKPDWLQAISESCELD
jgi:hypothetical protein